MADRNILLTGGSGRIGKILLAHFLSQGDNLFITTRSRESIDCMLSTYTCHAKQLDGISVDFTEPDAVTLILRSLKRASFDPDCLINNARALNFLRIDPDGQVSREDFLNEYLVDVVFPYELTMALARSTSRLQRVVNIGSQYGLVAANTALYTDSARQSPIHYSVAKAALGHLTKELAVRLAPQGVLVNCVAYGGVEGRVDEAFKHRYAQLCPLGRMLSDEDIAGPVDMLLSQKASGVTGHTMVVDGGWSIW